MLSTSSCRCSTEAMTDPVNDGRSNRPFSFPVSTHGRSELARRDPHGKMQGVNPRGSPHQLGFFRGMSQNPLRFPGQRDIRRHWGCWASRLVRAVSLRIRVREGSFTDRTKQQMFRRDLFRHGQRKPPGAHVRYNVQTFIFSYVYGASLTRFQQARSLTNHPPARYTESWT